MVHVKLLITFIFRINITFLFNLKCVLHKKVQILCSTKYLLHKIDK